MQVTGAVADTMVATAMSATEAASDAATDMAGVGRTVMVTGPAYSSEHPALALGSVPATGIPRLMLDTDMAPDMAIQAAISWREVGAVRDTRLHFCDRVSIFGGRNVPPANDLGHSE